MVKSLGLETLWKFLAMDNHRSRRHADAQYWLGYSTNHHWHRHICKAASVRRDPKPEKRASDKVSLTQQAWSCGRERGGHGRWRRRGILRSRFLRALRRRRAGPGWPGEPRPSR